MKGPCSISEDYTKGMHYMLSMLYQYDTWIAEQIVGDLKRCNDETAESMEKALEVIETVNRWYNKSLEKEKC